MRSNEHQAPARSVVFSPEMHPQLAADPRLAELLRISGAPVADDFEEFWRSTYTLARNIAPRPELHPTRSSAPGYSVHEVSFDSWDGARLRGWIARPLHHPVRRGLVISHGYGGRTRPDPIALVADAAVIYPCARGISLSRHSIPEVDRPHVLRGIESREQYVFRGCAADVWAAASALVELEPAAGERLDYVGSSFGGGIGALALPWDPRFARGFLGVPSFGNHPLRVTIPCTGSGEHVRTHVAAHPEALEVLRYFDASCAARFLQRPTLVECALADSAVPPEGQFAVFNSLSGPRELFVRRASHRAYPEGASENAAVRAAITRFFHA